MTADETVRFFCEFVGVNDARFNRNQGACFIWLSMKFLSAFLTEKDGAKILLMCRRGLKKVGPRRLRDKLNSYH